MKKGKDSEKTMREYLLRAKRESNGEWYIGQDVMRNNVRGELCLSNPGPDDWVKVVPETLGQYTGKKDKNGNRIFKGDILKFHYPEPDIDGTECSSSLYEVFWDKNLAGFGVKEIGTGYYNTLEGDTWEVIGNIYDNPELLTDRGADP